MLNVFMGKSLERPVLLTLFSPLEFEIQLYGI
jgi:hypothetical protein